MSGKHRMLKWFSSDHLPLELKNIVNKFEYLAHQLDCTMEDGTEKSAGMRKLLEAKDCFVRAKIEESQE